MERRRAQGDSEPHGAHPVWLYVEMGWRRARDHVPHHRRYRGDPADSTASRRVLREALYSKILTARAKQYQYAVEDRRRWECDQWDRLGSSRFCCSWQALRSRRHMAWGALLPQQNWPPRVSRSVQREWDFLRATALPRKAQSSLSIR